MAKRGRPRIYGLKEVENKFKLFKETNVGDELYIRLSLYHEYLKTVTITDIINVSENITIIKSKHKKDNQMWAVNPNHNIQRLLGVSYISTVKIRHRGLIQYKICRYGECKHLGILQPVENFYCHNNGSYYSYCKVCNNLVSSQKYKLRKKNRYKKERKNEKLAEFTEVDFNKLDSYVKENYL